MYVPSWPTLSPRYLLPSRSADGLPFPLSAPRKRCFYLARYGIYSLFTALRLQKGEGVLVPAYHHGNEVKAIRAAGADVRFYSINRRLEPDLDELEKLSRSGPRVLYVIHYLGWPQPMEQLMALCRDREMILFEDCALALFSEREGRPLGAFGDYSVFCLYKTLPVPNGGLLVQNADPPVVLNGSGLRPPDLASVCARSAELLLEWIRSRSDRLGKGLFWLKRAVGRGLNGLEVERMAVGGIGFDLAEADVAMSSLCDTLIRRFDHEMIRRRRRENFRLLLERLAGHATPLLSELQEGVCPLFFPLLVPDKQAAARALERRGISAIEFWNYGDPQASAEEFPDAQFLRAHVLELPIHQDVTPPRLDYMAEQIARLKLRM